MEDFKNQVELIENREIRGLSFKTGLAILVSTITIIISIVSFYFLLKGDIQTLKANIDTVNLNKVKDDKYNDLRMQMMETQLKELQTRVENLSNDVKDNTESRYKKN